MSTEARIWEALDGVTDPEYPISIVDLGMVYEVRMEGEVARVMLTFTSIGCPAIEMIMEDVERAARQVPGVRQVRTDVVWSPPWTKDRITDRGRRVLAMYGVTD